VFVDSIHHVVDLVVHFVVREASFTEPVKNSSSLADSALFDKPSGTGRKENDEMEYSRLVAISQGSELTILVQKAARSRR